MAEGSWHSFLTVDGLGVAVKLTEKDGQFVVTDVYLEAARISPEMLRSVPLSRLEAKANVGGGVLEKMRISNAKENEEPTISEFRSGFATGRSAAGLDRHRVLRSDRPRLTRPTGSDTEAFYKLVADAYREYVAVTRSAVAEIAKEAEVPVGTAHRWVKEARRRNFLPPGQRGRAG